MKTKEQFMAGEIEVPKNKTYHFLRRCEFCKYDWWARKQFPRQCPNCKRQIKYKHIKK